MHYEGQPVDPDHVDRRTSPDEDAQATDLLRRFMPHATGHLRESQVCLYTNTPDLHFVIDVAPGASEAGRGGERVLGPRVQVRDGDR